MQNKAYYFRVYVVNDGPRSGLLLARKKANEPHTSYAYFWLDEPEGLPATGKIAVHCDAGCHKLEYAEKYTAEKHKFARYRNQELLFRELKAYAEQVAVHPDTINLPRSLTQDYSYVRYGYPDAMSSFFTTSDSELVSFFIDYKIFRECVLKNLSGKQMVVGRAEEFAFFNPQNVFPEDTHRDCIREIEKILEIGKPQGKEWFSRKGVFANDFDQRRIFIRENRVQQLENLLRGNTLSLLCGNHATGKSVLVLNLAYNLFNTGNRQVYYLDCAKYRNFDQSQLVRDIKSVEGFFIIENIHLELSKIQWVCSEFKYDSKRNILFTARLSNEKSKESLLEDLPKMECIEIKPFEEVDDLIEYYSSHPEGFNIPHDARQQIKKACSESFRLLGYALKGYTDLKGCGTPYDWYAHGVTKDLTHLEHIPAFPRILVALSPLYKNEVLTAQDYLTNTLGFDIIHLKELVRLGEITEQVTKKDHTLYGLPHSGLADAYWEHGRNYIDDERLREYEEFIYKYAISNVPNGFEAIIKAEESTRANILLSLDNAGNTLVDIVSREQSLDIIRDWLYKFCSLQNCSDILLQSLVQKVVRIGNFSKIGALFAAIHTINKQKALTFWRYFDKHKMAQSLSQREPLNELTNCVSELRMSDSNMASELCQILDFAALAQRFDQASAMDVCDCIDSIYSTDKISGKRVLNHFGKENLFVKVGALDNVFYITGCIHRIFKMDENLGRKLVDYVDAARLAKMLCQEDNVFLIGEGFFKLRTSNANTAKHVCGLLNFDLLSKKLTVSDNAFKVIYCIARLCEADPKSAEKLCHLLSLQDLADKVKQSSELFTICNDIWDIAQTNVDFWKKLWVALDMEWLISKLSKIEDYFLLCQILRVLFSLDIHAGWRLWHLLNDQELATYLSQHKDSYSYLCLTILKEVCPEANDALFNLLNFQLMESGLSKKNSVLELIRCLEIVNKTSTSERNGCGYSHKSPQYKLNQTTNISCISDCVAANSSCGLSILHNACDLLDISLLKNL